MRLMVVDAFTDEPFAGNPAAVAVLDEFPPMARMQAIAREMQLSETAFVVRRSDDVFDLRWFTPSTEVKLCGHATLAAAHVLGGTARFHTASGELACHGDDAWITMDCPMHSPNPSPLPFVPPMFEEYRWAGVTSDAWLIELASAGLVINLVPDLAAIAALGRQMVIVSTEAEPGADHDIVSRVFAPNVGIAEDPVTGSAHCALAPYWAKRLGRQALVGRQASPRGGIVRMELSDPDRVLLAGQAVTVSEVTLLVS